MPSASTPEDILFAAAMRLGPTWHHLLADLTALEVLDEYDDVISPYLALLKLVAAGLNRRIKAGTFPVGTRRDVKQTFTLLAALASRPVAQERAEHHLDE